LRRVHLYEYLQTNPDITAISCELTRSRGDEAFFTLTTYGCKTAVSQTDLQDLFSSAAVKTRDTPKFVYGSQAISFPTSQIPADEGVGALAGDMSSTSWSRPALTCIPEGARLLAVLASGRRREHVIKLTLELTEEEKEGKNPDDAELKVFLDPKQTKITERWKRMNTNFPVYVNENSVPATVLPINGTDTLYCCAANALEVKGGGLRAEGLTLLPAGRLSSVKDLVWPDPARKY
jgi:hypothetical protein